MYKINLLSKPENIYLLEELLEEQYCGFEQDIQNEFLYIVYSENDKINSDISDLLETYSIEDIGEDWKDRWKISVKPFEYKEYFVHPPWIDNKQGKKNIIINPAMAFGTGDHETTMLCMEYIIDMQNKPKNMLDIGTGSGILSIIAYLNGIEYVDGFDIDQDSIDSALENLELNNLKDKVNLRCAYIEDYSKEYDFIIANMITERLKLVIDHAYSILAKDGTLVLSGILGSELEDFKLFLKKRFENITFKKEEAKNEWRLIEIGKS